MAGSLSYGWYKFFLMKYILAVCIMALMLSVAVPASAQLKGFSIGPYVEAGWPLSDLKNTHKQGFGGGISADIKLPGKIGLTGSAGYMQFNGKTLVTPEGAENNIPDLKAFPVRAGLKYRPAPLIYFKVEGGAANFTGSGASGSAFILSPGIGLRILGIDLQAKYEAWLKDGMNNAFWGLRAGLNL
jgi:hypothetical protein